MRSIFAVFFDDVKKISITNTLVAHYRMTIIQQTPIKNEGKAVDIGLGSSYASQLGLADIVEYDASSSPSKPTEPVENQSNQGDKSGKKKKKNNKKKKKKK